MFLPSTDHCSVLDFFFFNDTATTEIYTLSLHDALPISKPANQVALVRFANGKAGKVSALTEPWIPYQFNIDLLDRKSTRLNSSHANISYAVFCLKKKKNKSQHIIMSSLYVSILHVTDTT